ncbi:MAG: tetratricopeptide repeat protein [Chloroflexi bacterium]|nr:tetratricopeptide repeat protein [Chloroflexota bacterium]
MDLDEPDLQALLREGIAAAKAAQQEANAQDTPPQSKIRRIGPAKTSQRERARQLLLQVTELDETNITAWLWLSTVLDSAEEQQICLENALTLDPENKAARAGLARLDQLARTPRPESEPTKTKQPPAGQNNATPQLETSPPPRQGKVVPTPPKKAGGIPCPFCQQPITATEATCSHCHLPLVMTCPACGAAVDVEQKSCAQCGQAMGNYRQRTGYFTGLAAAYRENQRFVDALKAWQAVKTIKPDYPDLLLRLGEAQLGVGRPDRATTLFQRALEQNPRSPEAHFAMGELLRQHGERQEAFTYYEKVTQLDPKHGLAWLRLGQLYEGARQRQDANQAYRRAAALLSADSSESRQARQQLDLLNPGLPEAMAAGWAELLRQMTGPVLICVLAALLDAGLRPWWIHWSGWLALLLAPLGAFLWISGTSLPRNPLIRLLIGEEGLPSGGGLRIPIAVIGAGCWLLALALILLPLGHQSIPEVPPFPA